MAISMCNYDAYVLGSLYLYFFSIARKEKVHQKMNEIKSFSFVQKMSNFYIMQQSIGLE